MTGRSWRFAPAAVVTAALAGALGRWFVQGSWNLYTAVDKRFYVPDPDLGWRVSTQHPIWIGLDACAITAAIAVGLVVAGVVIGRRGGRALRVGSWVVAAIPLALPIAAFASGLGPLDGRDTLPPRAAVVVESGIEGSLAAPAGRYVVVPHAGTSITAHLRAGGEAFDARFDRDITGAWQGDPHDLTRPMQAQIAVAAAAVDTGVGKRTTHAREGYLRATDFPQIAVELHGALAVRQSGPAELAFRAPATVQLLGKTHHLEVTGTLTRPDAAAQARLAVDGDVLLVQADFALAIHETALAKDAGDFDGDRIPVHVSLVLRRAP